jgi:hypothetical protein
MPITPLFTISQTAGIPDKITITDTSTGRRIYLEKATGGYLVPDGTTTDYILWPLATNPFTFSVLKKDMALRIRVDWNDGNYFLKFNNTDFILINSADKIIK